MMTFTDIDEVLTNGFHDATILHFSLDAEANTLTMRMSVWVGTLEDPERYGNIEVIAKSVSVFFIEPPHPSYPFQMNGHGLAVCGDSPEIGVSQFISEGAEKVLSKLPSDAGSYRFFLEDWNSFLYVAAEDVSFSWV
jgi:hypothetical protein